MNEEKRIAVCKPHWTGFIGRIIVCAFFLILAIYGLFSSDADGVRAPFVISMLVIAAILALSILITCKTTYLALTETKLIGHIGFIKSKTLTTPLSRVQDIGIGNGLFGKIFGYHTITVSNAGTAGTEYAFKRMGKAKEFADAVQNAITAKEYPGN